MPLLFYRTDFKPERSQAEIHQLLRQAGARRISVEYTATGATVGMSFTLETARGEREFTLPARVERVQAVLERQGVLIRSRPDEHAAAVAWRTLLEWLKLQLAIIETEQAAADEVMLPYMLVPSERNGHKQSLYEQYRADRALPAGGR